MKAYERRAAGIVEAFNLDRWDEATGCWKKTSRKVFNSAEEAKASAIQPGKYRLSRVDGRNRTECEPFTI